jgi:hypothetical protein
MSETDRLTFDEQKILDYLNTEADGNVSWRRAGRSSASEPGDWYVLTELSVGEAQPHELGKYEGQVTERRVFYDEDEEGMPRVKTVFYLNAQ